LAARRLSKIDFADNAGAQMARFEREWKAAPNGISDDTLIAWYGWLAVLAERTPEHLGDAEPGRAQRLLNEVDLALWERNAGPYAEGKAA
jgi:hypothetical protein